MRHEIRIHRWQYIGDIAEKYLPEGRVELVRVNGRFCWIEVEEDGCEDRERNKRWFGNGR